MARPPSGPRLVHTLEGEDEAKLRLEVILGTISGELTIREACQQLGVGEARFHQLRRRALQAALVDLEPHQTGRPRRAEPAPEAERVEALERRVQELETEQIALELREELATLPHRRRGKKGGTEPFRTAPRSAAEREAAAARKAAKREARLRRGAELRRLREQQGS